MCETFFSTPRQILGLAIFEVEFSCTDVTRLISQWNLLTAVVFRLSQPCQATSTSSNTSCPSSSKLSWEPPTGEFLSTLADAKPLQVWKGWKQTSLCSRFHQSRCLKAGLTDFKDAMWSFLVNKLKLCLLDGVPLIWTLLHSTTSGQTVNRVALIFTIWTGWVLHGLVVSLVFHWLHFWWQN